MPMIEVSPSSTVTTPPNVSNRKFIKRSSFGNRNSNHNNHINHNTNGDNNNQDMICNNCGKYGHLFFIPLSGGGAPVMALAGVVGVFFAGIILLPGSTNQTDLKPTQLSTGLFAE